jgi:ribose-phosphate pyrophosphokinase
VLLESVDADRCRADTRPRAHLRAARDQVARLQARRRHREPPLVEEIARCLGVELCKLTCTRFADGEIFVRVDENIRGMDLFIVQPTNPPADHLMELLLLVDAARRASAARITVVMPYYGYSRQDRKDQPRVAIGAKLVANMIEAAGADRVLGVDFHQHQLQGFFDIPVDHLYARPGAGEPLPAQAAQATSWWSRPTWARRRWRAASRASSTPAFAILDKRRPRANVAEVLNVIGEVDGPPCVIVDDMIDTAGTVAEASRALLQRGAREVYVCATHALLSGPAPQRLTDAPDHRGHRHRHDRHPTRAALPQAAGAERRRAARQGHPLHAQRPVGELAVRVVRA